MKHFKFLLLTCIISIIISSLHTTEKPIFTIPDIPKWQDIPIKKIPAYDNIKLAYREIAPANAKKALIFIHGVTMYGYYYIPMMEKFREKNIIIRVIDVRGHGYSDGKRGDTPDKDSVLFDLKTHIADIRKKYDNIKIFIGGHSMGAGICGRFTEKYPDSDLAGVIYLVPFFHYKQSGMKDTGFVDVSVIKLIFGGDHSITHIYHPAANDPKHVRTYTKIMSASAMIDDYKKFRKENPVKSLIAIGKKDELFQWSDLLNDFDANTNFTKQSLDNETHLGIISAGIDYIIEWMNE